MPRSPRARAALVVPLAVLAALPAPRPAAAQADTVPRTDPFCWRGRPLPRCRAFAIFEIGAHTPVASTDVAAPALSGSTELRSRSIAPQVTWSVGALRNVDSDSLTALGGALVVGFNDRGGLVGGQVRWRRWLGRTTSVELGAGPLAMQMPALYRRQPGAEGPVLGEAFRLGGAVDARLNYADRVAAGVRLVAVPADGRLQGAVLAGGNVGSGVAVAGTVGLGVLVAAAIYALARSFY